MAMFFFVFGLIVVGLMKWVKSYGGGMTREWIGKTTRNVDDYLEGSMVVSMALGGLREALRETLGFLVCLDSIMVLGVTTETWKLCNPFLAFSSVSIVSISHCSCCFTW